MKLLEFVFRDVWTFLGVALLLDISLKGLALVVGAFNR